jgi:uncharacterized membrane protein
MPHRDRLLRGPAHSQTLGRRHTPRIGDGGSSRDRRRLWVGRVHSYEPAERSTTYRSAVTSDAGTKLFVIGAPQSDPQTVPPDHSGLAAKRVVVGALGGIVVAGIALAHGTSWSVGALGATDVAALIFVAWVWTSVAGADARATARLALAEDASRTAAEAVLLGAGAASLLAVGFTLAQASHARAAGSGWLTALALASVALAWSAVHTVYALRYARLYYTPPSGGIDFKGERPDYLDFAYLALTIGMTFQVSDTDLVGKRVRRQALRHALTSYVFGTVIVAITVSSVASLLGR